MRRFLGLSTSTGQKSSNSHHQANEKELASTPSKQSTKVKHVAFVPTPPIPHHEEIPPHFPSASTTLPPSLDSRHGLSSICLPHQSSISETTEDRNELQGELTMASISPRPSLPLSFAHSTTTGSISRTVSAQSSTPSHLSINYSPSSPYSPGLSTTPLRLPSQNQNEEGIIHSPIRWSEMVNEDLVDNLGLREKTRQEVLWEIVGSEERFVEELRGLVECFVKPLLRPGGIGKGFESIKPAKESTIERGGTKTELPIAAKFLRAVNPTPSSDSPTTSRRTRPDEEIPEIDVEENDKTRWGTTIREKDYGPLGIGVGRKVDGGIYHSTSTSSIFSQSLSPPPLNPIKPINRLRHPLRKIPSSTKLHKKFPPPFESPGPILPEELRKILVTIEGMLGDHERLAEELRRRWRVDFPLVRGLGGIWSDLVSLSFLSFVLLVVINECGGNSHGFSRRIPHTSSSFLPSSPSSTPSSPPPIPQTSPHIPPLQHSTQKKRNR